MKRGGVDPRKRALLTGRLFSPSRPALPRREPLGPPPPALTAALARARVCTGCDAPCIGVCEPDVIRRHPADHALAGVAFLDFGNAGCTWCNACIDACPIETGGDTPPKRLGLARLDRSACIAWDGVVCLSCQTACPVDAVSTRAGVRPTVEADTCDGCGQCVAVCPADAVHVA